MSNEEILNKRWLKTDKILRNYQKKFNSLSIDTIDELIEVFNSLDITYVDLNKIISKAEKRKFDKKIKDWKKRGILTGYFAYLISSKNKITYADLLEILVYAIYVNQEEEIKKLSKEIFTLVAEDIYMQAIEERKTKKKKKFSLTWEYIWSLLWIPTYNKSWDSYLQLLTLTNEQEMYKQLLTIIQQEKLINENVLKDLIKKQMNRIISINDDKYSGILSDTCRQLGNKIYIEPFKEEKDLQVRFIAEIDKRTTKMCNGMNNMLFYVNDWNKFYRYSDMDDRDVLYTVKGLEQGINLPPINNHFHWCRSTITYLLEESIAENVRTNIKIANDYDREQYARYKKYFENEIPDNVEDFVKMKLNDVEKWDNFKKEYYNMKKKYNEEKNYTKEEIQALNYYISPSSIKLNEKLRNKLELNKTEKNVIKNLDSALNKTSNYEGNIVRVLQMENPYDFVNNLKLNDTYNTNQYLSFSNKEEYNPNANIKIYISNSKYGKDLTKINKIGEKEILYQRNKEFKILNITSKNGIIYMLWEEL